MAKPNTAGVLGPPPIQTLPSGLLGLLGIKNGGQYPQNIDPTLQPTIDLLDWYLQTNSEVVFSGPVSLTTVGNTLITPFTVPAHEYWAINDWGSELTLGAGEAISVAIGYTVGGAMQLLSSRETITAAAAAMMNLKMDKQRPLILPPGTSMGYVVSSITGNIDGLNTLRITRLAI